mmetsp:Transcript_96775/g.298347  ORF Transcript_96775/g.298347 Transcript_96775/m.298347 type:complete len:208 (-) Transcript_96775:954-1577(-)
MPVAQSEARLGRGELCRSLLSAPGQLAEQVLCLPSIAQGSCGVLLGEVSPCQHVQRGCLLGLAVQTPEEGQGLVRHLHGPPGVALCEAHLGERQRGAALAAAVAGLAEESRCLLHDAQGLVGLPPGRVPPGRRLERRGRGPRLARGAEERGRGLGRLQGRSGAAALELRLHENFQLHGRLAGPIAQLAEERLRPAGHLFGLVQAASV